MKVYWGFGVCQDGAISTHCSPLRSEIKMGEHGEVHIQVLLPQRQTKPLTKPSESVLY